MLVAKLTTRGLFLLMAVAAASAQTATQTATQRATQTATPANPQTKQANPPDAAATAKPAVPVAHRKAAAAKSTLPSYNPNVVLLDAGHGGTDDGARLGKDSLEKDATLAFANRLRPLLTSRGFTVVMTHESADNDTAFDARIEAANRSHAGACLLIHMANAGHGVHLFTSSLGPVAVPTPASDPKDPNDAHDPRPILLWDTAQAASIPQSLRLSSELANVLYSIRMPLVVAHASVQPIDSLNCPAVTLELAPLLRSGGPSNATSSDAPSTPASDANYQQRIAEAVAAALNSWRGKLTAETAAAAAAKTPEKTSARPPKAATPPAPKPRSIPVETPDLLATPPMPKPAPIVRRPPPVTPNPSAGPPQ